jgi:hypothetical protein
LEFVAGFPSFVPMLLKYTIQYQAGPYSGTRDVIAEDDNEAVEKVRAKIREEMSISMYADSYKIIDVNPCDQ